jgi:hypothetical protein
LTCVTCLSAAVTVEVLAIHLRRAGGGWSCYRARALLAAVTIPDRIARQGAELDDQGPKASAVLRSNNWRHEPMEASSCSTYCCPTRAHLATLFSTSAIAQGAGATELSPEHVSLLESLARGSSR